MSSNLPAVIETDLSILRRLTLQDIHNAYFSRTPICGFYIQDMGIGTSEAHGIVGLKCITLTHEHTGMTIDLDEDGGARIKG